MEIPDKGFPVPYVKEFNIHDATKIKEYMSCPRRYFYNYVLGWKSEAPNIHLEFGAAYHLGLEELTLNGYEPDNIIEANKKFFEHYSKFYSQDYEKQNAPKNASNALKSFVEYTEHYKRTDNFEVLHTEVAGTVPIGDGARLNFKIDAIVKDADGIYLLEHKTASRDSATWRAQWLIDMQISIYTHALYCMYGDKVWGAKVNGVVLLKGGNKFVRIPIRKTRSSMETWLWTVNHWTNMIKWDFDRLLEAKPSDPILTAFPMNDRACTDWGRTCIFHAYCIAWQNPLTRCNQCPPGMKVEHWNPQEEHAKTAKTEVTL